MHEHLVTEQSILVADVKFSGLSAEAGDPADTMVQESMKIAEVVATSKLPTTGALSGDGSERSSNTCHRPAIKMGLKVGKNGGTSSRSSNLACFWTALVACAATINSIPAVPISNGGKHFGLESLSTEHGGKWDPIPSTLSTRFPQPGLHGGQSSTLLLSTRSDGCEAHLPGGSNPGGYDAARASKGLSGQIKRLVALEAKREAKLMIDSHQRDLAVRELVGAKGGLPSLKKDLMKLANVANVEFDEKTTVD